jgi:plastocyanin
VFSMIVPSLRRRLLLLVTALLGAAVVVLPAVAGSETSPTIVAVNTLGLYEEQHHSWSPATATVSTGGVVTLSNPTEVKHGVRWVGGPATPTCSSGVPVGTTEAASGTKWSGTCTFAQPGTYTFYCTVHGPEMTGTITVDPDGTTTTTMTMPPPTTTAPTTATPGQPGSETTSGSPLAGSAAQAVKLASSQHGSSVHGSVKVSQAGAGGRLEVALLGRSASLAKVKHPSEVRVGRLVRSSLTAGVVAFTVPLTAKARAALRRHRRLVLTVRIVLTPVHGASVTVTRSVVERA